MGHLGDIQRAVTIKNGTLENFGIQVSGQDVGDTWIENINVNVLQNTGSSGPGLWLSHVAATYVNNFNMYYSAGPDNAHIDALSFYLIGQVRVDNANVLINAPYEYYTGMIFQYVASGG